jgi:protein tyrosine phosphatase (PTP) superfamily phosphohydrolase (DUF442 family)
VWLGNGYFTIQNGAAICRSKGCFVTSPSSLPNVAPYVPPEKGWHKAYAMLALTFVDHGFIRAVYCNRHRVTDTLWRSAQPGPSHLRWAKENGVKTVLNLRGRNDHTGWFRVERDACAVLDLELINFPCRSRGMPEKSTLHAAAKLFGEMRHPVLMHCKSGADRAGFMSALYLHLHERRPIEEAMGQLSIRYGHAKAAKTGMLDRFLERYAADTAGDPDQFLHWVDEMYDPVAFSAEFQETRFGAFLIDRVLRRE